MKLPAAFTIGTRDGTLDKDALMKNALAENIPQSEQMRAIKRPAIDSAFTTTAGIGQGLFTWNTLDGEVLIAISDDTLVYGNSITTLPKYLGFTVEPS